MKTYSSEAKAKDKRSRVLGAVVSVASVIVVTLTVVLAVVFTRPKADVGVDAPILTPDDGNEPSAGVDAPETKFVLPVDNATLVRDCSLTELVYMPSLNMWRSHNGLDFAAAEGATVMSVADGVVKGVVSTTLEGTVVTIDHGNGLTSCIRSLASACVAEGDAVKAGQAIGVAGTMLTELSDGVHVHLEMTAGGELVDPAEYLDAVINK